jgi:hypothetical protein
MIINPKLDKSCCSKRLLECNIPAVPSPVLLPTKVSGPAGFLAVDDGPLEPLSTLELTPTS